MVGRIEIALSRDLILRAGRRLSYQDAIVSQLGCGSAVRHERSVYGIHSVMRNKLERLIRQHDDLLAGTREGSPCRKMS